MDCTECKSKLDRILEILELSQIKPAPKKKSGVKTDFYLFLESKNFNGSMLSRELELNEQTVYLWLTNNERKPSKNNMNRIAKFFDVDYKDIYNLFVKV